MSYGKILIENRRGTSSHNHNPYFILDRDATETSGEVFFGALRLTGNFSGVVEQTPYGETLVQMGINPHDCLLALEPGQTLTARPSCAATRPPALRRCPTTCTASPWTTS